MAGESLMRMNRQLGYYGGQNALGTTGLQNSLLGYLSTGEPTPIPYGPFAGGSFPGGMTLGEMGFQGEVVPSAGPLLSQAFGMAGGLAGSPEYAQRSQALSTLMSGQPTFQADPAMRERYFQQAISDPAMLQFNQEMLPAIAARFGRGGNLGAANWAGAQAGQQLAGSLAGQRAGLLRGDEQLALQSRENALARMMQAVPMSFQNQYQPMQVLGQFGGIERGIRGEQNAQRLQETIMAQPWGDPRLSLLGMLGQGGAGVPGQASAPSASGGGGNSLLGLASAVLNPVPGIINAIGGLF